MIFDMRVISRNRNRMLEKFKKLEEIRLPAHFDYGSLASLRNEARTRFNQIQPLNLGQASRIPGVTPADITVLMIYLKKGEIRA